MGLSPRLSPGPGLGSGALSVHHSNVTASLRNGLPLSCLASSLTALRNSSADSSDFIALKTAALATSSEDRRGTSWSK